MQTQVTDTLDDRQGMSTVERPYAEPRDVGTSMRVCKLRRALAGSVALAALAVAALIQAPVGQASARTVHSTGVASRHVQAPGRSVVTQGHRRAVRFTVRMRILSIHHGHHHRGRPSAIAAGEGRTTWDCGTATLTVYPPANNFFSITLASSEGAINWGYWNVSTNGVGSLSENGLISGNGSPYWAKDGNDADPGLWPTEAWTQGLINTTDATCVFAVTAPWNDVLDGE